jgi:transposase/AmiR/NasT family two-component response regulator
MASVVQEQQEQAHLQALPADLAGQALAPVILTAQTLLRERDDITSGLREARFDLRYVAAWNRLPEAIDRIRADIVVIDMDAADLMCDGFQNISGHRLVMLLTQQLAHRPVALVVMTRLDFVEIEDLARAGVHAIVSPAISAYAFIEQARIALQNARKRHHPLSGALMPTPLAPAEGDTHADEQALLAGKDDGWRLSDQLWQRIEALLPATRHPERTRPLDRQAMDAIFFVLRSGVHWSRLPETFCSAATARGRLRQWAARGIIEELLAAGLDARTTWEHLHWERLAPVFPPTVARIAKTRPARTTAAPTVAVAQPCAITSAVETPNLAAVADRGAVVGTTRTFRRSKAGRIRTPRITITASEAAAKQSVTP